MLEQPPTGSFARDDDGVDPELVPQRVLADGAKIPAIGLGTFGSDRLPAEEIAEAVLGRRRWAIGISIAPPFTAMSELIGHSFIR